MTREEKSAYNKAYRKLHPRVDYMRFWRASRKQKIKAWQAANRLKRNAQQRAYSAQNPARVRANLAKYRNSHKAVIAQRKRAWHQKNRESIYLRNANRRALEKRAAVNLAGLKAFVKAVKSRAFATCYYCEARVPTTEIAFDHIVALTKGGTHSADNLCVACKPCNGSKYNKPLAEWLKSRGGQQLLSL